jgi:hypothetical protein
MELVDGEAPNGCVPLSDGVRFKPDVEITLKAGCVTPSRPSSPASWCATASRSPVTTVDARIIRTLIGNAGLAARVAATRITHLALVQYD